MHAVAIPAPIYVPWEVRESAAQQRRSGVSPGPLARWGGSRANTAGSARRFPGQMNAAALRLALTVFPRVPYIAGLSGPCRFILAEQGGGVAQLVRAAES
jgi:hypothetical protein